jgi:hypothetical protein
VLILLLLEYNNVILEFELHHYRILCPSFKKTQICDEDARNLTTLERILNVFVRHLKYGNLTITMDCPRAREFPLMRVFSFL